MLNKIKKLDNYQQYIIQYRPQLMFSGIRYMTKMLMSTSASKRPAGQLFTWGNNKISLGHNNKSEVPTKVQGFDNVVQVSLGVKHSAFITQDGKLFSFGEGGDGQLGHNDNGKDHRRPKQIEFFSKNNLKVADVKCGQKHTIVRTSDGDVFTFGWGGRKLNCSVGPLGHGDNKSHFTPTPVQLLRTKSQTKIITAGRNSSTALNINGEIYNWGNGEYGAFGDGDNQSFTLPKLNDYIDHLKVDKNLIIEKLKSCGTFSVGLFSDNKLYGWGSNESGQIGVESQIGVELYETVQLPTEVISTDYKGKIIDFDISSNLLIFLLQNGELWWSGMRVAFRPQRAALNLSEAPLKIGASTSCWAIATKQHLYFTNEFIDAKKEQEDIKTGIKKIKIADYFDNRTKLIDIGGEHQNRYAIVN